MGLSYAFGPRGSGVGSLSWVPSPGQWAAVSLNVMTDVPRTVEPNNGSSWGGTNGMMATWAGGAYAPELGELGSLLYGPNGGHASYNGNDVYCYDIRTRLFSILKTTYENTAADGDGTFGEYPDGSPVPPHTYGSSSVATRYGTYGRLVLAYSPPDTTLAAYVPYCHFLDLETLTWTRGPDIGTERSRGRLSGHISGHLVDQADSDVELTPSDRRWRGDQLCC